MLPACLGEEYGRRLKESVAVFPRARVITGEEGLHSAPLIRRSCNCFVGFIFLWWKACAAHTCKHRRHGDSCQDWRDVADVSSPFVIGKFCVYLDQFFCTIHAMMLRPCSWTSFISRTLPFTLAWRGAAMNASGFPISWSFYMISDWARKTALSSKGLFLKDVTVSGQ